MSVLLSSGLKRKQLSGVGHLATETLVRIPVVLYRGACIQCLAQAPDPADPDPRGHCDGPCNWISATQVGDSD